MTERLPSEAMTVQRFGGLVSEAIGKLEIEGLTPIAAQIIEEDMDQLRNNHPEVYEQYMAQLEQEHQEHLSLLS